MEQGCSKHPEGGMAPGHPRPVFQALGTSLLLVLAGYSKHVGLQPGQGGII